MCIIAAKPAGIPMPDHDTLNLMWTNNPDGAGLMYVDNGHVIIEKGYMKWKDFRKAIDRLSKRLDLKRTPVVMHFRIATHGGVNKECCHPFPVTDSIGALKKLKASVDLGVAHNGIINSVNPRKGCSDTMEYIATQLAPLKRAMPRFYDNKHARLLVQNAIDSKMAFLTQDGRIFTIGDFVTDNGVLYSNRTYRDMGYRSLYWGCYGWDEGVSDDDWNRYYPGYSKTKSDPKPMYKDLCWLGDGYITYLGEMHEGYEFMIDREGGVWQYDYGKDAATPVDGAQAFTPAGTPARFDEEDADCVAICLDDDLPY